MNAFFLLVYKCFLATPFMATVHGPDCVFDTCHYCALFGRNSLWTSFILFLWMAMVDSFIWLVLKLSVIHTWIKEMVCGILCSEWLQGIWWLNFDDILTRTTMDFSEHSCMCAPMRVCSDLAARLIECLNCDSSHIRLSRTIDNCSSAAF